MEKTATSRSNAGGIFSIDVVATVLSRRAVDILAGACPPRGIHCCNQANAAAGDPSTSHPVLPLLRGNLSRPSSSLECSPRASSACGRPNRASGYTGRSHEGATSTYKSSSPTTRQVSGAPRSCSGLPPRSSATPAEVSESFFRCKEITSPANSAHGSETCTHRESRSTKSSSSSGGGFLEGCVNDFRIPVDSREAPSGEHTSVSQPSADYVERRQCDRRRRTSAGSHAFAEEGNSSASEAVAASAAVSCFRPGDHPQRNSTDTKEISADWKESNTRDGSRRKNSAEGSIHTSKCSNPQRSAWRASEKDAKSLYSRVTHGKNEGEGSREEFCRALSPLEQVHNFLAAALRTARSSLYVCLPIRATEAPSLGCTYCRPSTVTSVPERTSDGTIGGEDREAAGSKFPLQASGTDFVVHWNDALRGQSTGSTAEAVCACSPLSSQPANGNNSFAALPSKTASVADAVAAAPGTASADAVAPASGTASAAFSHTSQAASAATYAAAVASVTVSSGAAAPLAASSWHDGGQARAKRTSLTAARHANGFCCTFAQLDSGQVVVTPTCCVFCIIYHLYAFLTSCAAAFAPFAADVYVVPVWVDAETGDARASYGGAAASNTTAGGSEIAPGKAAAAGAPAFRAAPAAAAAPAFAAGERGRTAGEEGAAEETASGSATGASRASAPASSEVSRTAVGTPRGEGDNFCEWQCRLLRALQSHCRSCRGLRVTEGKMVNLVDSAFEVADRGFAVFSSAAGELATCSYALETSTLNVSHLQSFSEVLSTLMIPAVPITSGVETHAGEGETTAAATAEGASVCATEAAAESEEEPHQQTQATLGPAAEAKRSGTASAKPAAAAVTAKALAFEATGADVAADAAAGEKAASEDTAEDGIASVAERRRCELNGLRCAGAVCQFRHVIVAGTFDRLHAGHKLMLTVAALLTSERLGIGLTSGALVQKKAGGDAAEAAAAVQTFAVRAHAAAAFVALIASAAQATAPPAAVSNREKSASAASIPAAASVPRECVAATPGDDVAVAEAAEFGDICSLATTVVPDDGRPCKEGPATVEVGCAETAHLVSKDDHSSARVVQAASPADEVVARREEASRMLRAHAEEDSGEAAALSRKTSSWPLHFVNYFQVVLGDDVGKLAGRQNGSSVRCACVRRTDADVNPQGHSRHVATQDEGRAWVSAEGAEARGAEERFFREEGKRETTRGFVGDTGFEGGDAAENYTGSETENEAKCQATRADREDDGGIRTRGTAAAAEGSNVTDAAMGVQEQAVWEECRATRGVSVSPSEKRSEQQGLAARGGDEIPDTEEHLEQGIVDVETREKQWTKLVFKGLAETETTETASDAQPSSATSRVNRTFVTSTQENMHGAQSPYSSCISSDGDFPHPEYDRIFLPWTSSVVPPNFFPDASLLACKKRFGSSVVPRDSTAGAVENTGSDHTGPAEPICALSAAAIAHPTAVASASAALTASPESSAASTGSRAACPSSTASFGSGHEGSRVLSSSPVPLFPACTAAGSAWAAVANLGFQRRTTGAPLSRASVFSQREDPPCVALIRSTCSGAPVSVYLMPIEDRLGPAGDVAFDALVVSSESLAGGFYVNEERIKRSHPAVCLVEVPAVLTSNQPVISRARTASVSEEHATPPLRRPAGLPVVESASCFLPGGSSLLHLGRAPEPPRSNLTSLAEERPGAPGGGLGIPHIKRYNGATHACASADSGRGRSSTTSSPIYEETLKEQFAATSSRVLSDSRATQEAETWKLDWATPEDLVHRPSTSESLNAAEYIQSINERVQEEEGNVPHPVACDTCAHGVNKQDHVRAECFRLAADLINKVSSSELRQKQAAALNSDVDMGALRRGFAAAVDVLVPAPESVCQTYWSLLCSLHVAPWRRLFTLERVARQLMRFDEVKKRVPGLSCWGRICDAIVVLSLYFAYAVHPPPGLCSHPGSPAHTAPAAASRTLSPVGVCAGRTPGGCSGTWVLEGGWRSQTLPPKSSSESLGSQSHAAGPGSIPRKGDAFAFAAEHSVSSDALVANEQLMHDFFRDAAICTRLFAYWPGADSAKQPLVSGACNKESICGHLASMLKDATQIVVDHAPVEGDLQGMKSSPATGYTRVLRIMVSCIRTARESCGFLLPCRPFSPVWQQETKCTTHDCFREESRLLHVRDKMLTPGRSACRSKSCVVKRGADLLRSKLEPPDGVSTVLQLLESKCCRVVRMLEFLELALPERIYELCARRMREEYYHVCDPHYARQRNEHLQALQSQLSENAHDLTEAELALIKRNLLREQQALGLNMLECAVEGSNSACACSM